MAAEDWNLFDDVKRPFHYEGDGKISCMDAMKSMMHNSETDACVAYWWGCAFKYLWRWPNKNGVEDLKKARQCLDYLIDELEEDEHGERDDD